MEKKENKIVRKMTPQEYRLFCEELDKIQNSFQDLIAGLSVEQAIKAVGALSESVLDHIASSTLDQRNEVCDQKETPEKWCTYIKKYYVSLFIKVMGLDEKLSETRKGGGQKI